jgi:hypothetical protein
MNVEMMMVYSVGNLLCAVGKAIRSDETVKQSFNGLLRVLPPQEGASAESSNMSDVIMEYAKMRFASALSGRRTNEPEQLRTCPPETK